MSSKDGTPVLGTKKVALLLLIGCHNAIVSINHTLPTFHGYTPHFFCQVENVSASIEGCVKELNNTKIRENEPSCPQGYHFVSDRGDWTVATEWQLLCERRFLRPLVATLYFGGVTIGAFICGFLADRYGRRPVVVACLYIQGLLGASLYLSKSLELFMAIRFLQGFFVQGLQGATFTLLIELFPTKYRTAVTIVIEVYWCVGNMFLAGASYCFPQWRPLQLFISLPTAATLLYVCMIPESPRWLATHSNGKDSKSLWDRIVYARKKIQPTESQVLKNVNLTNDINNIGKKEIKTDPLEKYETGYIFHNDITNVARKLSNNYETDQNFSPYAIGSDFQNKSSVEAKDSPNPILNKPVNVVIHKTSDNEGNIRDDDHKYEEKESPQQENCEIIHGGDNLSQTSVDNVKNKEPETQIVANGDKNAVLNCLWKEIVNELGYDVEKTLSDMQESSKKSDEAHEMDQIGSSSYTANDIEVDSTSMKDLGTSKKQDSDDESIASQVNGLDRDQLHLAETKSLMYPDEGIITDLDDISVDQKDFGNSIISFSNKQEPMTDQKKAGFVDLFKSRVLRKYNYIMVYVWFSVSVSYYGIMFHLPSLSGERHLNFFLGAVLEASSSCVLYFILEKFGRRIPMGSFQLITSIACLTISAISVIPKEDTPWIGHLQTVLALLGKTCGICAFATMFLYTSELFPTVLRAVAMGHCGFWARIGSLLAPQLLFLGEHTIPAVPLIIIGIMGLLAGCSVFALPETLGQQLPDTIEDAELLAYSKKKAAT